MKALLLAGLLLAFVRLAGAATIEDFGGGCAVADNTPAFNAASAALEPGTDHTLAFGACRYDFATAPNPIPYGLWIVGQGLSVTDLRAGFSGADFFWYTGAHNSGGGIRDVALYALAGAAPGTAIRLEGNATSQPDMWRGENVYITGAGTWYANVKAYGVARISPQGLREVSLTNVQGFNATGASFWLSNVVGLHMIGGGAYTGTGCTFYVAGYGTPSTNSTLNDFWGVHNNCPLSISNSTLGTWLGGEVGSLTTDASTYWRITTINSGALVNNLVHSKVDLLP